MIGADYFWIRQRKSGLIHGVNNNNKNFRKFESFELSHFGSLEQEILK